MAEDQADGKPFKRTNNGVKRQGFMAKLYDEEAFDDEMRVFGMEDAADEEQRVIQEGASDQETTTKKRVSKDQSKKSNKSKEVAASKISKLNFNVSSLGLFAICEITKSYLIVNYTRNTKGFIKVQPGQEELAEKLRVGDFVVAQVLSKGTSTYNTETSGNRNKKLQLSVIPELINKSLTADNLQTNMLLQGIVESKEAKGFLVNFGLKDKTKGFLPFNKETEKF